MMPSGEGLYVSKGHFIWPGSKNLLNYGSSVVSIIMGVSLNIRCRGIVGDAMLF